MSEHLVLVKHGVPLRFNDPRWYTVEDDADLDDAIKIIPDNQEPSCEYCRNVVKGERCDSCGAPRKARNS